MKPSLSDRDYELISAYLDGEVQPHQKKIVEERLAQEEQFKLAYEQLLSTRALLRSQPRLRAPRNYTLSPKTVAASQPSARSFFPLPSLLRAASALASLVFVILFGLNWLAKGSMMSSAPVESEMLFQAAPAEATADQPSLSRSAPGEEQPLAKGMPTAAPSPFALVPPAGDVGGMGGGGGTGAPADGGVEAPLLQPYSATQLMAPTETLTTTLLPSPAEITAEIGMQSELAPLPDSLSESQPASEVSETRLLMQSLRENWLLRQILYGVLAISFAVIAIRIGKRKA